MRRHRGMGLRRSLPCGCSKPPFRHSVHHRATEATEGHGAHHTTTRKLHHKGTKGTNDTTKREKQKVLWTPMPEGHQSPSCPSCLRGEFLGGAGSGSLVRQPSAGSVRRDIEEPAVLREGYPAAVGRPHRLGRRSVPRDQLHRIRAIRVHGVGAAALLGDEYLGIYKSVLPL